MAKRQLNKINGLMDLTMPEPNKYVNETYIGNQVLAWILDKQLLAEK